jgi:hypothetical protein
MLDKLDYMINNKIKGSVPTSHNNPHTYPSDLMNILHALNYFNHFNNQLYKDFQEKVEKLYEEYLIRNCIYPSNHECGHPTFSECFVYHTNLRLPHTIT